MTIPLPLLYTFRRCPYAIRARLALLYAGTPVEWREVVLRDKPEALLSLSPKGTVPVMRLGSGQVLEESMDIVRWALSQSDPQGWARRGDAAEVQALIDRNDGPFKQLLDRYKYPERFPDRPAAAWRAEAVELHLAPLDRQLSGRPQLFGQEPSIADVALMPFVRQFAQVDAPWFEGCGLKALAAWLGAWVASPLFAQAMQKRPAWHPGDAVVMLGAGSPAGPADS